MKKKIIFGVFVLALISINIIQEFSDESVGFSFGELLKSASASTETGGSNPCSTTMYITDEDLIPCYSSGGYYGHLSERFECDLGNSGTCSTGSFYWKYDCSTKVGGGGETIYCD